MRTELQRIETDAGNPVHRHAQGRGNHRVCCREAQIVIERLAGVLGQLEPDRPTRFSLPNSRTVQRVPYSRDGRKA